MHTIRRVGALQLLVPAASGRPLRGQDLIGIIESDGVLSDTARYQCDAANAQAVRPLHELCQAVTLRPVSRTPSKIRQIVFR